MTYTFRYKRSLFAFWHKKEVIGHSLETFGLTKEPTGAMILYLPDSTVYRIPNWKDCYMYLDKSWLLFQKKSMENESGQTINTRF